MPEPLFIVRDNSGNVMFDSRDAAAGICVGFISVPANTSHTVTYPEYAGHTLRLVPAAWVTVDNDLGYPRAVFDSMSARSYVGFMT